MSRSLSKKDLELAWSAMGDAIRDREAMVYSYTFPAYVTVDAESKLQRRRAVATVKKYQRLREKFAEMLKTVDV